MYLSMYIHVHVLQRLGVLWVAFLGEYLIAWVRRKKNELGKKRFQVLALSFYFSFLDFSVAIRSSEDL